jgi:hypothetical protein
MGAGNLYVKRIMIYTTYIFGVIGVQKFEQIPLVGHLGIEANGFRSLGLSAC